LSGQDAQGWELWLTHLPITVDTEEGVKVHKQLCQLLGQQHASLLGPNGARLGACVGVLLEVYKGTSSDDEVNAMIRESVKGVEARLPSLSLEKHAKKVQRVLRDYVKEGGIQAAK
jgi:hypothetical protein